MATREEDMFSESDDESDVEDDITCKHDTNDDGKYYTCCMFVYNSDKILDIIHKCSFECTYETCLKLEDLKETKCIIYAMLVNIVSNMFNP